jgi:hypothetical protein
MTTSLTVSRARRGAVRFTSQFEIDEHPRGMLHLIPMSIENYSLSDLRRVDGGHDVTIDMTGPAEIFWHGFDEVLDLAELDVV